MVEALRLLGRFWNDRFSGISPTSEKGVNILLMPWNSGWKISGEEIVWLPIGTGASSLLDSEYSILEY